MRNSSSGALALRAVCVLAVALCPSPTSAQTLKIVTAEGTVAFTLEQLKAQLSSHVVTVDDPTYLKQKKFDAFRLQDVLSIAGALQGSDRRVLLFRAADGYMPHLSTKYVSTEAYLAYGENGSAGAFEPIEAAGNVMDPGPYYLVWSGTSSDALPWPYQLVEIEVVSDFASRFADLEPRRPASPTVLRGFQLFESECMKCHSINNLGGRVGPELNIPKNVTEYFDDGDLRRYIHNPQSIRQGAKMPAFAHLGDKGIRALVEYLKAMKQRKVLPAR